MWERGLKHAASDSLEELRLVAPRVGAWVETLRWPRHSDLRPVAPHAGAWIETGLVNMR